VCAYACPLAACALSEDVEFKPIPGHNPDLVLLSDAGDELQRIDLAPMTRDQCNELLIHNGFDHKPNAPVDKASEGGEL
jgi:hypothetical protein